MAWTITDQAFSSLTNFAVAVVVAREASAREFGAFSIAFTTYLLLVGTSRALCTDALVIRFSGESRDRNEAARAALGAVLLVSLAASLLCALIGAMVAGPVGQQLNVLSLMIPGLLVQDGIRFTFFALGKPARAAMSDAIWAAGQSLAFVVLIGQGRSSPTWLIAGWGIAGAVAAAVPLVRFRMWPAASASLRWLRAHRDLSLRYLFDFLGMVGSVQLTIYGVGVITGLEAAGSLRGAWLLLGPLNVLFFAAVNVTVPEGVRLLSEGRSRVLVLCKALAIGLPAVAGVWVAVLLALPSRLGTELLGPSWASAREVLPLLGVALAANGVLVAADSGLRALANARRGLRARLFMLPLTILGGLGGALVGDASGAAAGLVVADVLGGVIWWSQFRAAYAEEPSADGRLVANPVV